MNVKKITSIFIFVISSISLSVAVSAHTGEDYYGHHGMMGGFYGWVGMGFFAWIFMILILIILILLVIWLMGQIQRQNKETKRK